MPSGVELATAWVTVVPTFTGVQAAVTKGFAGTSTAASAAGKDTGSHFVNGAGLSLKKLGGIIAGAFVVKEIAEFVSAGLQAVQRIERISAQTTAVIASTGSAANVTTDHIVNLTKRLEDFTATEAETIQEGANMLLTFKNIRNEAGAGNDIFDQSVLALTDMSRAMGSDMPTAAIQMGKALNDPIAGMGALARVGVQFTDDQKALITTLVESGDVMGAQKIILEELNSQFGGSGAAFAETYAGKIALLGDKFGEVSEKIAIALMPALDTLLDFLDTDVVPAFEDLAKWFVSDGLPAIEGFFGFLADNKDTLGPVAAGIGLVTGALWLLNAAIAANPIVLAIAGVVAGLAWLGATIHFVATDFEASQQLVIDVAKVAADAVESAWNHFFTWWTEGWAKIGSQFATARQAINDGVFWLWDQIVAGFSNGGTEISTWWTEGWAKIGSQFATARQAINDGVFWLWDQIVAGFSNGWTQITTWWNSLWRSVWTTLITWATTIGSVVLTFIGGLVSSFSNGWTQITGFFSGAVETITGLVNGVLRTFERVAQGIRDAFSGIGKFIADAFGGIGDFLGGIAGAFSSFFGGLGDKARHFKGKVSSLAAQRQAALASSGGGPAAAGSALARVRATLPAGLRITDTLSSPSRDAMFGIVRSPNSYHYDAANPAVDIAGPSGLLFAYAAQLRAMGGWRQMLWQVAGHYDHIHVAHGGGVVESSWPRMWGDAADERTIRAQVGETIVPKGAWDAAAQHAWQPPDRHRHHDDDRSRAGVVINGGVSTNDLGEFIDRLERAKNRAYALAAPATG